MPRSWANERFLDRAGTQKERYGFGGTQPTILTRTNIQHDEIAQSLCAALRARLRAVRSASPAPISGSAPSATRSVFPAA